LKVSRFYQTSRGYPAQWDAIDSDGRIVSIIYQGGWLSVEENGREIFFARLGSTRDGQMTTTRMQTLTRFLIQWPEAGNTISDA
jgi:hypothetical protein